MMPIQNNKLRMWLIPILMLVVLFLIVLSTVLGVSSSVSTRITDMQMFTAGPAALAPAAAASANKCVYDQTTFSSKNKVVMYYAPWCTYCTTFRPEFDKAASQAKATGLDVCFLTVNSDMQPKGSTCFKDKGATAFPTVQLETEGNATGYYAVYNGLRNSTDLLSWVNASLPARHT